MRQKSNRSGDWKLVLHRDAVEDLVYWIETDRKIALRVMKLIEAVLRDPFEGIGKPEPLKHLGTTIWSRRITDVDRLVYGIGEGEIVVLQARYHY